MTSALTVRIVTALGRTMELQENLDLLYPEVERETVVLKPEAGEANAKLPAGKSRLERRRRG